RSSRISHS
ncbi:hypothetical protein CP061683_0435B, partial [Chlamydia psittaci 06-1683]